MAANPNANGRLLTVPKAGRELGCHRVLRRQSHHDPRRKYISRNEIDRIEREKEGA
jgi:hypothetical protein